MSKKIINIGPYKILNEIGRGATSTVHMAKNTVTEEGLCVKIMDKESLEADDNMTFFRREVGILSGLNHPNIVKYFDLLEDSNNYYIFMEYCPGESLQGIIERPGKLQESYIATIFRQILEGLKYLHEQNVSHRDLKPDNIIVGSHGKVKIVDFGLSTDDASKLRTTFCGSLAFAAPECITKEPYLAPLSDIWSAGVILYMMAVGRLPWNTSSLPKMMKLIVNGSFSIPSSVPFAIQSLINMMMKVNPSERPSATQCLNHAFLKQNISKPKPPPSTAQKAPTSSSAFFRPRLNSMGRIASPRVMKRVNSDPRFCVTPPPTPPPGTSSGVRRQQQQQQRPRTARGRSHSVDYHAMKETSFFEDEGNTPSILVATN